MKTISRYCNNHHTYSSSIYFSGWIWRSTHLHRMIRTTFYQNSIHVSYKKEWEVVDKGQGQVVQLHKLPASCHRQHHLLARPQKLDRQPEMGVRPSNQTPKCLSVVACPRESYSYSVAILSNVMIQMFFIARMFPVTMWWTLESRVGDAKWWKWALQVLRSRKKSIGWFELPV